MAQMDGQTDYPQTIEQKRENAAYEAALRFARDAYTPEARVVELVDKSRAADNDAQRFTPRATLWHALIALDDGRHAIIGVRDQSARGDQDDQDDQDDQRTHAGRDTRGEWDEHGVGAWSAFVVSGPTLGDPE